MHLGKLLRNCSNNSNNIQWCLFSPAGSIAALRLTEVRIPNHTVRGSTARLECHYEMDGEALYSVKWYKDGNEFYRYVPRDMPPVLIFQLPGVSVDLHNSTDTLVVLQSVNLSASGRYRCEVSAEAPSFQTVSDHGDMIVVGKFSFDTKFNHKCCFHIF
uniref:Uncharacterized protein n=1 Tax=Phlebotomus papatasi TaxID=29031 RepID=A0A1B0DBD1_PHLPP